MPIHVIWGDDTAAHKHAVKILIQQIVDPTWSTFNLTKLDGSDDGQSFQALEEIRTPPLGNGGRLVLVQNSSLFNNCSNELAKTFEDIFPLIPKKSHLVLCNPNKPDGRLKTTKSLQKLVKNNEAFEQSYNLPAIWDERGQKELIERTAKDLGYFLESEAISLLVDALGNDSTRIRSELIKLSLLQDAENEKDNKDSKKNLISTETVKKLIQGISTNSLQIGECLLKQNLGAAIHRIDALLDSGEPALKILSTITGQVRGWVWVALLEQQGERDVKKIAQAAGISNPKRIYILRKQLVGVSTERLLWLLSNCLEIESTLKKGIHPSDAFRDGLLSRDKFAK